MLRRCLRILGTSLTILSLILFLATIAAWVRSYRTWDGWMRRSGGAVTFELYTPRGRIGIAWGHFWSNSAFLDGWDHLSFPASSLQSSTFIFRRERQSEPDGDGWFVVFPTWLPASLFAILPALKLRAILRARKQTRGFDVITNPEVSDQKSEVGN